RTRQRASPAPEQRPRAWPSTTKTASCWASAGTRATWTAAEATSHEARRPTRPPHVRYPKNATANPTSAAFQSRTGLPASRRATRSSSSSTAAHSVPTNSTPSDWTPPSYAATPSTTSPRSLPARSPAWPAASPTPTPPTTPAPPTTWNTATHSSEVSRTWVAQAHASLISPRQSETSPGGERFRQIDKRCSLLTSLRSPAWLTDFESSVPKTPPLEDRQISATVSRY